MTEKEAISLIFEEVRRAEAKYPDWPDEVIHGAAIVCEESGELIRAALNHAYHGTPKADMTLEAIQTGATVIRFLCNSIDYM